jgi:hypothetical protein
MYGTNILLKLWSIESLPTDHWIHSGMNDHNRIRERYLPLINVRKQVGIIKITNARRNPLNENLKGTNFIFFKNISNTKTDNAV